ncbi:MAG: RNA polymerase sigma factor [Oscillospiraceae bacterium]
MNDEEIIELFFERSQSAISKLSQKYSRYCHSIAYNILYNQEDAEECANDTYLRVWNAIPPKHPECLGAFVGKIVRNLSLNRLKSYNTQKRNGGEVPLALCELEECIPSNENIENTISGAELSEKINLFLQELPLQNRIVFVKRYWYLQPISTIATELGRGESYVKSSLLRTRNKLKLYLEKEGVVL